MPPYFLRLAYMAEFLLALVSITELWGQVGGQGHLDLMPWYVKLGFVAGLALTTVAGTASAVAHERAWNAKTVACLLIALLLAGGMGGVTYYYHVHENDDADNGEETNVATAGLRAGTCAAGDHHVRARGGNLL
ncbi:MAG TPA: hypothetical protein VNX18_01660 [Bryobacteraceae bacterium]|nr:hypothetical protein [Bryobacteraceae bacterium]